jgi:hypothetical protein
MSLIDDFKDRFLNQWGALTSIVRKKIFGANNENVDLLVDSFYKLEPPQRNAAIAGGSVGLVVIVVVFLGVYFAQLSSLNRELNRRFDALYEIRDLKDSYQVENARFIALESSISGSSSTVRMRPYFEKIANEQGVKIDGLTESKAPIASDNALSAKFQEIRVEMRLNNISIPKLLAFLVEVEKGGGSIRIQDLQVQAKYGTKLFFDAKIKARSFAEAG